MNITDYNFDWSWFAWGTFGFLLGMISQYLKYQPRIVKTGGFRPMYFIQDNKPRLILGFITCLIASQAFQDTNPWMFLFNCIAFDTLIDRFTNRKK